MPRTLPVAVQAAAAGGAAVVVHLLEWSSSGGSLRLATAAQDIAWDGYTWTAAGGALGFGSVEESADRDTQGVRLELSGVDTAVLGVLLGNQLRGQPLRIWRAYLDASAGTIIGEPIELFRGFQNDAYELEESRSDDHAPGSARVTTRVLSRLAELKERRAVRTNVASHQDMLVRAGQSPTDTFFRHVPQLVNKPVYWGTKAPSGGTSGGTGSAGGEVGEAGRGGRGNEFRRRS